MSSFAKALQTAQEATAGQNFPVSCLYMVATPIGNLADISLRALRTLELADSIACEDTRHTQQLLHAYGLEKSPAQLLAVHHHNEHEGAAKVIERLQQGQRVAYVSDAGTPGISDPGAILAHEVLKVGFHIMPLPGASSVITAISATALLSTSADNQGFVFVGFIPPKAKAREAAIGQLQHEPRAVVLLEAPHRITELAKALATMDDRRVTLARELTKQFEQIQTMPAKDLSAWLEGDVTRSKGEFVVVVHPLDHASTQVEADQAQHVLQLLLKEGMSVRSAVRTTAEITGQPRNGLYELALGLQKEGN